MKLLIVGILLVLLVLSSGCSEQQDLEPITYVGTVTAMSPITVYNAFTERIIGTQVYFDDGTNFPIYGNIDLKLGVEYEIVLSSPDRRGLMRLKSIKTLK